MNLSRYFAVAFLLLGLLPCAIAQSDNKNVTELPGREEDLPEEILNASNKEVVKFNGTEIVTRSGNESDKCVKACNSETKIDCHYYRYITAKDTCLLFSSKLEISGGFQTADSKESGNQDGNDEQSQTEGNGNQDEDYTASGQSQTSDSEENGNHDVHNTASGQSQTSDSQENGNQDEANTASGQTQTSDSEENGNHDEANTASGQSQTSDGEENGNHDEANTASGQSQTSDSEENGNQDEDNTASGQSQTSDSEENGNHDEANTAAEHKMYKEIQELEVAQEITNSTVHDIDNKVAVVNKNNNAIKSKLSKVIRQDKKTASKLNHISKKEANIEKEVKSLTSTLEQLGSDVVGVKISNDKITDELEHSDTKSPVLDRQLKTIKRELADLKSKVEMNPTVFKITKNQRVLAEALESIDRELTIFERKLGHIDDISDEIGGRLTKEELHRKTLNGALQTLTSAVRAIRSDIDKIENPLSEINVKRNAVSKSIKSDVNVLIKNNKKLTHDSSKMKSELNNLLKDLLVVQQGNQEGKTSIAALVEFNKNMKQDFSTMNQDQEHMMTKIQTLATVYRSVLTALHNMEIKQIQVVHRMKQYEQSLHRLSRDFLGKKMKVGRGSNRAPTMSSNLTSYSNLLVSQRNLYSQLLSLQNEVRALKGLPAPTTAPPPAASTLSHKQRTDTGKSGRLNLMDRLKPVHKLHSEMKNKEEDSRRSKYTDSSEDDRRSKYSREEEEEGNQETTQSRPWTQPDTNQPSPDQHQPYHVKTGVLTDDSLGSIIKKESIQKILDDAGQENKKYNINFSGNKAQVKEDNTPD